VGQFAFGRNWTVAVAALAGVPLTVLQIEGETGVWITAVDWVIWAVFTVDLAFDMREDDRRPGFWRRHWLGIVIVVLTFPITPMLLHGLRLARLARAARLIRLVATTSKAARGLRATVGRRGMAYVSMVTVLVIASSAGGIVIVEPDLAHGSYWDGVWWAIVTATTVGYGDIAPGTLPGRLIATVLMLTGIGLASTLSGSVGAYFVAGEDAHDLRQVSERFDRIEAMLHEIRRDLRAQAMGTDGPVITPGDGKEGPSQGFSPDGRSDGGRDHPQADDRMRGANT
jgi:voltage-gated potassium channel